jgi:hypothetical protein
MAINSPTVWLGATLNWLEPEGGMWTFMIKLSPGEKNPVLEVPRGEGSGEAGRGLVGVDVDVGEDGVGV